MLTQRQKDLWVTPEALAAHLDRQCLKEEIAPEDMIDPTLFLASDASRMVTGQALVVDGGVVGDREQPVRELPLFWLVRVETAERFDERVLRQVLGQRPIVYHAGNEVEHGALEAMHDFPERALRPGERLDHELLISYAHVHPVRSVSLASFAVGS